MSISEDPLYPWALHRLAVLHRKVGNYQLALNSAYESQDMRLYKQDVQANQVFDETILELGEWVKEAKG